MEAVMIETQGVIASSTLNAGKYNNDGEGGESGTSDLPDVDTSGSIFGD